jgi:hypothetical protein
VTTIGPKECTVVLSIGVRDFTTTFVKYKYFLNTIAEQSLCFGPGLQEEGMVGVKSRFMIQAINELKENRTSGADEFNIAVCKKVCVEEESVDANGRSPLVLFYILFYTRRHLWTRMVGVLEYFCVEMISNHSSAKKTGATNML